MSGAAEKKAPASTDDPVRRALARAPVGPPLTAEERRAKAEAMAEDLWADGDELSAEIARRCKAGE